MQPYETSSSTYYPQQHKDRQPFQPQFQQPTYYQPSQIPQPAVYINQYQPGYSSYPPDHAQLKEEEQLAIIFFIGGFFINLVWLFGWLKFKSSRNLEAQKWGKYSLYAFIITLVISIGSVAMFMVIWIAAIGSAASH